jgi:hypothetical protein
VKWAPSLVTRLIRRLYHVIHRQAFRFVRSFESRSRCAHCNGFEAGVVLTHRACGGRRRRVVGWNSKGWPLSICGAAPLRKLPEASSGSSATNIRVVRMALGSIAAKHPRVNILNLAEAVSWRRASSQVASANRTGEAYA